MTDARLSTAFPSHPKTKKLLRRLGEAGPLGCVYLILWAAQNRTDGDLSGLTDEDLELAVDWRGQPGALIREMADVGFLEGGEGARRMHDWQEHQPYLAGSEDRSERGKWASLVRRYGRNEASRLMPEYAARLSATSKDSAATSSDSSANSTPVAGKTGGVVQLQADISLLKPAGSGQNACPVSGTGSGTGSVSGTKAKAKAAPSAGAELALLLDAGIEPDLARDFLAVRRAKKAPLTATALAGIVREATKAQLTLESALRVCCERGWSGYKADWQGATPAGRAAEPERRRQLL